MSLLQRRSRAGILLLLLAALVLLAFCAPLPSNAQGGGDADGAAALVAREKEKQVAAKEKQSHAADEVPAVDATAEEAPDDKAETLSPRKPRQGVRRAKPRGGSGVRFRKRTADDADAGKDAASSDAEPTKGEKATSTDAPAAAPTSVKDGAVAKVAAPTDAKADGAAIAKAADKLKQREARERSREAIEDEREEQETKREDREDKIIESEEAEKEAAGGGAATKKPVAAARKDGKIEEELEREAAEEEAEGVHHDEPRSPISEDGQWKRQAAASAANCERKNVWRSHFFCVPCDCLCFCFAEQNACPRGCSGHGQCFRQLRHRALCNFAAGPSLASPSCWRSQFLALRFFFFFSAVPKGSDKHACACEDGYEGSACDQTVGAGGAGESSPSFLTTLLLLVLLIVGVERSVWLARKQCGSTESAHDTTGFSRVETVLDEHDEQFDAEPFGDEPTNQRL